MQAVAALDAKLLFFLNGMAGKSPFADALFKFSAEYLQYVFIAFFFLFLFIFGFSRQDKIKLYLTAFISAALSRLIITELIRFFYYRPRPFIVYELNQLIAKDGSIGSFPSGHSAFFFALAMAVYFYNKKWGLLFLSGAVLLNVSRVIAGVHYPSDILGGALIGIASAYSVFYIAGKLKKYAG